MLKNSKIHLKIGDEEIQEVEHKRWSLLSIAVTLLV